MVDNNVFLRTGRGVLLRRQTAPNHFEILVRRRRDQAPVRRAPGGRPMDRYFLENASWRAARMLMAFSGGG